MKIAILGCGPAGLLAAHAIAQAGHEPVIFSRKEPSKIFGAMYLHSAIPGITEEQPELEIIVTKNGTREGYAWNVYGDVDHPVSWDKFEEGVTFGWDLTAAYAKLWERFAQAIEPMDLSYFSAIDRICGQFRLVYSSIPLPTICFIGWHRHRSQTIWVQHGQGDLIEGVNDDDMMYYNGYPPDGSVEGLEGPPWYRFSQIKGYQSWEFSRKPAEDPWGPYVLDQGVKPISSDCDCWAQIRRIGRFGRWEKQVLTHDAYFSVVHDMERIADSGVVR